MNSVTFAPDLDVQIAEQVVRPHLENALSMLHDAARRLAPDCKVWVSMRDPLVRTSHVATDGQTIPDNLRFILPRPGSSSTAAGSEMARQPRDPALSTGNAINCRCEPVPSPSPLRTSIHKTQVQVAGTRVYGEVYTEFPRAAESEFGTSQDQPAAFMSNALREVASRLQSGQTR